MGGGKEDNCKTKLDAKLETQKFSNHQIFKSLNFLKPLLILTNNYYICRNF